VDHTLAVAMSAQSKLGCCTEEGCEILICDKDTSYGELDDVLWIKLIVFIVNY
jgi:hypothetical protein